MRAGACRLLRIGLIVAALPTGGQASSLVVKIADPAAHAAERCEEHLQQRLGDRRQRALFRHAKLAHIDRVSLPATTPLSEALSAYAADPHVAWVQKDNTHDVDSLPNDPFLSSSGSWGQGFEDLWGVFRIHAPEAWAISQGEGVIVAVVDTGVDYEHPDIADNIWVNPGEDLDANGRVDESDFNGIDDDGNGFIDDLRGFDFADSVDGNADGDYADAEDTSDSDPLDERGHGTHVAGTIAALADNGLGIAGIAPRATLMPLKGFPREGPGLDSDLWRAVLYAAENGARVINTSWSCNPLCPDNPLAEEIVRLVHAMDVVIVTSAGNHLTDVLFNSPENMRETITVASHGEDDRPSASFSNHGWLVDVAAPGGGPSDDRSVRIARRNILSLRASTNSDDLLSVGGDYYRLSGTSMAAPHVSGVAALLLSARPELGYESVRRRLRQAATDLLAPGHDPGTGAGRLDALATLTDPPLPTLTAALTAPRQGAVFKPRQGTQVSIRGTAAGDDLADWELAYGLGNEPDRWLEITASREPVREGVLADWQVDGLDPGTYTLRLQVYADDGSVFSEFLILSLEHNEFQLLSQPGRPVVRPDLSGSLLVWQSRRDPEDPFLAADDTNIFASDLRSGRHFAISAAPGDQRAPSVSRGVISWLDGRAGVNAREVFGCRLHRRTGTCPEFSVSQGESTTFPPAVARGRVFWLDARSGVSDLNACRPGGIGRPCRAYETDLEPTPRAFLESDGRNLTWIEAGNRIAFCRVDRRRGTCLRQSLDEPILTASRPTSSGNLVAWVKLTFRGDNILQLCERAADTGRCQTLDVMRAVGDDAPKLQGNRLVWDAKIGDQASDVFFCEYDSIRRECPVQRLTAHVARQAGSDLDGHHVVFEDDRAGPTQVRGLHLPVLKKLRHQKIRAGKRLRVPVRSHTRELALSAESAGGASLAELGARFFDRGQGRGLLVWRPRPDQLGSHAFTFQGTTRSGLVTRQTIRIEVTRPQPRWKKLRRFWRRIAQRSMGAKSLEMLLEDR
jgi:subtilisin family serine protease